MNKAILIPILFSSAVSAVEIENSFSGYNLELYKNQRYWQDVNLDGIDWAFWYGKDKSVSKVDSGLISKISLVGDVTIVTNKPVHGNKYYWRGGSYADYLNESGYGFTFNGDGSGISFTISPKKAGDFTVDVYSHNWISSSITTACVDSECVVSDNDITLYMTANKNKIRFTTVNAEQRLTVKLTRKASQWDFYEDHGYYSIEAINVKEGK